MDVGTLQVRCTESKSVPSAWAFFQSKLRSGTQTPTGVLRLLTQPAPLEKVKGHSKRLRTDPRLKEKRVALMGPGVLEPIPGCECAALAITIGSGRLRTVVYRVPCVAADSAQRDPCPVSRGHTPTYVGVRGL